jgi:hypothetical protein
VPVGQKSEMADAHKSLRKHVQASQSRCGNGQTERGRHDLSFAPTQERR